MDEHGFHPYGLQCTECGALLGGRRAESLPGFPSYDRPAELYAGTFTGLCYACEKGGPRLLRRDWDGALHISYPPHCPAWRRDREVQIAYADCPECKGTGRHYVSRADAQGGSYYQFCRPCLDRYCAEPHRQEWAAWRIAVKLADYEKPYQRALYKLLGVKKFAEMPFFPWTEAQTTSYRELNAYYRNLFQADRQAVEARIETALTTLMINVPQNVPLPTACTKLW
jgi:hypothetical protein